MLGEVLTTWWLLHRARASSHRPPQWFQRRQEATLRRLLVHAYRNVPLYRRLYDEAGFRPEMFRTHADLTRIPPLTKAALKAARSGEAVARGVDRNACTVASTSGSTGMPMQIALGPYERLITQLTPRRATWACRLVRIYQSSHVTQCHPVPERPLPASVPAALRFRCAM